MREELTNEDRIRIFKDYGVPDKLLHKVDAHWEAIPDHNYDVINAAMKQVEAATFPFGAPGTPDYVPLFESRIAAFFGAPFAVATDSCTHGLELCLRYKKYKAISVPNRTYLSVPLLADKLGIDLMWMDIAWQDYYYCQVDIIDAAVLWKPNSYIPGTFMCISFQYQKHLSLGRSGMILCDNKEAAFQLKKLSYDGRLPGIPWREQNIDTIGYHYYMTPETAALGLSKLDEAIATEPRKWISEDWPDLTQMKVFKK